MMCKRVTQTADRRVASLPVWFVPLSALLSHKLSSFAGLVCAVSQDVNVMSKDFVAIGSF